MGYARYLEKMFWPANFSVVYPYPILAGQPVAFCRRVGFGDFGSRLRPATAAAIFIGWVVVVYGNAGAGDRPDPVGGEFHFNRFTYIPMIGILILVVWVVDDFSKGWRHRMLPVTAVVVMLMGACIIRTRAELVYWKNGADTRPGGGRHQEQFPGPLLSRQRPLEFQSACRPGRV